MVGRPRVDQAREPATRTILAWPLVLAEPEPEAPCVDRIVVPAIRTIPAVRNAGMTLCFFVHRPTTIDSSPVFCANYPVQSYFGLPFCASVFGCLRRSKDPIVLSIV